MKIIAFITDYAMVDRINNCLNLICIAERSPQPLIASQELLIAIEISLNILHDFLVWRSGAVSFRFFASQTQPITQLDIPLTAFYSL